MHRSRRVFYTRLGWLIWSVPIGTIILLGIGYSWEMLWRALTVLVMVEIFAIGLMLETEYAIESDSWLRISGPLIHKRIIAVASIQRIEAVRNFNLAPAFSPERLAVHYSAGEVVLISPERRDEFIANLKALNSAIEVEI